MTQQKLVTRSELARMRVPPVSRSAVTHAAKPGGPLFHARFSDRIDAAHPDCVRWLGAAAAPQPDARRLLTFEELSAQTGIPLEELERDRHLFEEAVVEIDLDHPATRAFLAEHGVTDV